MSSVAKWEDQNYNDTRRVEIWQRSCLFINRFLSLATQFIPSICIFKGKEVTAPCRPKTIPWEIDDVVSYSHHQLHRLRKKGVWKQYCSVWSIFHWSKLHQNRERVWICRGQNMLETHGGRFLLYLCRLTRLCLFLLPLRPRALWLPRTPPRLREAVYCDCVLEKISHRAERGEQECHCSRG